MARLCRKGEGCGEGGVSVKAVGRDACAGAHPGVLARPAALALAVLACVCSSVDVWVLMTMAFPLLERLSPASVTVQAVAAAAGYAFVALLALKAPRLVSPAAFGAVSALMIVGGSLAWWCGMRAWNVPLACVGVCVAHFGCAWPRILVGAALCALGNKRDFVLAAFLGEGIGALLPSAAPRTPTPS